MPWNFGFLCLPGRSQKAQGSQRAPKKPPKGVQKAPRRFPKAPRKPRETSRRLPESSQKAPRKLPRGSQKASRGSRKVPKKLPEAAGKLQGSPKKAEGQDLALAPVNEHCLVLKSAPLWCFEILDFYSYQEASRRLPEFPRPLGLDALVFHTCVPVGSNPFVHLESVFCVCSKPLKRICWRVPLRAVVFLERRAFWARLYFLSYTLSC